MKGLLCVYINSVKLHPCRRCSRLKQTHLSSWLQPPSARTAAGVSGSPLLTWLEGSCTQTYCQDTKWPPETLSRKTGNDETDRQTDRETGSSRTVAVPAGSALWSTAAQTPPSVCSVAPRHDG